MLSRPIISWEALVSETTQHTVQYQYICKLLKVNANDPGYGELAVDYYVVDFIGHIYQIKEINYGGDATKVLVEDLLQEDFSYGPYNDRNAYVFDSLTKAALLSQAKLNRLDQSAEDFVRNLHLDPKYLEVDYIDFNTSYTGDLIQGRLQWNVDEDTLDIGQQNDVVQQIGAELSPMYKNQTGSTIYNGTPVMAAGAVGASGRVLIMPAIADGTYLPAYTLGVTTEDIANGDDGHVTWFGKVRGIDTTGTPYGEVWAEGDPIYVSATTAGHLTNIPPDAPNYRISIGIVINRHANNGTISVRPVWRSKITDLADVDDTPLDTDGQILVWDDTNQYFDPTHNINDYLRLDQTTPQTIENGIPLMTTNVSAGGSDYQIANKKYVDDNKLNSPLTTKGDIWTYSSVDTRLPVGTNGQILSADSTETTGLKWINPPSTMVYPGAGIAVSTGSAWGSSITPSTGYLYYNGTSFSWGTGGVSQWVTSGSDIYYNTGNVGIGTVAPESWAKLQVDGSEYTSFRIGMSYTVSYLTYANSSNVGPILNFRKYRGNLSSLSTVSDNDILGEVLFSGGYGSTALPGASIRATVNGTPGPSDMPGKLSFFTTPDGSSILNERMTISPSGNVGIGTTGPSEKLEVAGNINIDNTTKTGCIIGKAGGVNKWLLASYSDINAGSINDLGLYNYSGNIGFWAGGSERLFIKSDGKVGINQVTPSYNLDVTGTGRFTSKLYLGTTTAPATDTGTLNALVWDNTTGEVKQRAISGGTASPLTTKGDIWTYSTVDTRLPIGTNGQYLKVDSTTDTGLAWAAAPTPGLESVLDVSNVYDKSTTNKATYATIDIDIDIDPSNARNDLKLDSVIGYVGCYDATGSVYGNRNNITIGGMESYSNGSFYAIGTKNYVTTEGTLSTIYLNDSVTNIVAAVMGEIDGAINLNTGTLDYYAAIVGVDNTSGSHPSYAGYFDGKVLINDSLLIKDGISTAPSTVSGYAQIYVDSADGDLKVKFGDGTVKTIVTDS